MTPDHPIAWLLHQTRMAWTRFRCRPVKRHLAGAGLARVIMAALTSGASGGLWTCQVKHGVGSMIFEARAKVAVYSRGGRLPQPRPCRLDLMPWGPTCGRARHWRAGAAHVRGSKDAQAAFLLLSADQGPRS